MLWSVCFEYADVTSGYSYVGTIAVKADTKQQALDKFNKVANERREYPYCWKQATLKNVSSLEIIE